MLDAAFYTYRPQDGHGLRHDPFNTIVGPRPIGWISTVNDQGEHNLAPYSFFNAFNYKPPIIGFSSTSWKDTVSNIHKTGEFVWNLVTRPLAERMNISAADFAAQEDEFSFAKLEKKSSDLVRPPRVAASPVQFECRLSQMIQLKDAQGGEISTWLTLGEVVAVHIRQDLIEDGAYQMTKAMPVLRGGGRGTYVEVNPESLFELLRPSVEDATLFGAGLKPTP